jgi:hypothetical protein
VAGIRGLRRRRVRGPEGVVEVVSGAFVPPLESQAVSVIGTAQSDDQAGRSFHRFPRSWSPRSSRWRAEPSLKRGVLCSARIQPAASQRTRRCLPEHVCALGVELTGTGEGATWSATDRGPLSVVRHRYERPGCAGSVVARRRSLCCEFAPPMRFIRRLPLHHQERPAPHGLRVGLWSRWRLAIGADGRSGRSRSLRSRA